MEECNDINFSFLDEEEKKFSFSILIVLNSNFYREQFDLFRKKCDFVICLDDSINEVYNPAEK